MARTGGETADILKELYRDFECACLNPFRLTWAQLRGISGVARISDRYLEEVKEMLSRDGFALLPLENSIVVVRDRDLYLWDYLEAHLVERYRYREDSKPGTRGNDGKLSLVR
ncbi:hypothetical protein KP003_02765 [Geomonas nitrogeniifigens]|uniref:hypothetical protein n=1 Tax=Geomonas diazotrophica TaxID=2843197 RepID=UPI001C2C2843|nr:hypothetical protein [Geomonas nitrogeniifigens]QXE87346.1 hypothetical protein KP003_02765 [Geomonas nitrogeniifigens]